VPHPATRTDGSAGSAADWQLQTRADANPTYSSLGPANAIGVTERVVQNVPVGTWWFRVVWRDSDPSGPPVSREASIVIPLAPLVAGDVALDVAP
jgi:hypothetical protein